MKRSELHDELAARSDSGILARLHRERAAAWRKTEAAEEAKAFGRDRDTSHEPA